MKPRQINFFFKTLDQKLQLKGEVILLGASAGALMGHIRPSLDIDFEIRTRGSQRTVQQAIQSASEIAGVAVNYSENVGGGSRINYLDYRKTAIFYKKIGKLNIRLIAPEYWTIGKMARFLDLDLKDIIKIIRRKKIKPERLILIWAKAIRSSDLSLELGQFRDHVLYFLKVYGKKIWGKKFNLNQTIEIFKKRVGAEHFL